ncbi:MAG: hypothetical protein WCO56_20180 [Verrucomicrobiota bacterium]
MTAMTTTASINVIPLCLARRGGGSSCRWAAGAPGGFGMACFMSIT